MVEELISHAQGQPAHVLGHSLTHLQVSVDGVDTNVQSLGHEAELLVHLYNPVQQDSPVALRYLCLLTQQFWGDAVHLGSLSRQQVSVDVVHVLLALLRVLTFLAGEMAVGERAQVHDVVRQEEVEGVGEADLGQLLRNVESIGVITTPRLRLGLEATPMAGGDHFLLLAE